MTKFDEKQDRTLLWRVVVLSFGVRLVLAYFTPLGVDEAYAIAAAQEFSWAFFDHPPLGFWAPVFAADISGLDHPLIYRAPTLLFGTVTTFLIYGIGFELGKARAGIWAAILFALAPSFALSGVFVLPDGPLMLGSAFSVLWLVRIAKYDGAAPLGPWLWVGLGLAVAMASKYQAGFIPVSALIFAIVSPVGRRWFFTPGPYVASLIGLIGLVPVLVWNLQNDWVSFAFHTARTGSGVNLANWALMLVGQGIYLLPPVMVLAIIGLWKTLARPRPETLLLALIALGPIIAFNIVYLFSVKTFPHWTMPGWLFALPLAGMWLAKVNQSLMLRVRRWLVGFAGLALVLLALTVAHFNSGVLTRFTHDAPPEWDVTKSSFNYGGLQDALAQAGYLDGIELIATENWESAGIMSTALRGQWPVRVLDNNPHHFAYMSGHNMPGAALLLGAETLVNSARGQAKLLRMAKTTDPSARLLKPIIFKRGARDYLAVNIVLMTFPE